ncbi:VOC family protein [Pelagicoccus sp. NFK12]|uniref:VOC family protein n=1 Tax=Pelagicoccus enzymogenes TaxID=2773457 RepID=A0A927FA89_9BACT|nr:VOC family protein [Pelagicoccus enzymogenes]MBD5780700.1 VOC family protein [Pelagicoccus enzymogenes]
MKLGAFSISLTVKNIEASIDFYKKLDFTQIAGDPKQGWAILKSGEHVLGLFQGMFEKNTLTFNPGWDQSGAELDSFDDVRHIRDQLSKRGIPILKDDTGNPQGPGSIVIEDPDGNPILIDQHR